MLILGIIIVIVGWLLAIPIVYTIGAILAVVGLVLLLLEGVGGRTVGGRRWY